LRLGILTLQPHIELKGRTPLAKLFPRLSQPEPEPELVDEEAEAKNAAFWLDLKRVSFKTQTRARLN